MTKLEVLVENNPSVQSRLSILRAVESEMYRKLSTYVGAHPRLPEVVWKIPRKLRKLQLLFEIRKQLPWVLRLQVEQEYESKMSHIDKEQLTQLSALTRHLNDSTDDRFLKGRVPELLLEALEDCWCKYRFPKKPRRQQRRRGYSDGSGSSSEQIRQDSSARRDADLSGRMEKKYLYESLVLSELSAAEVILARERSGESAQAISGNPSAAQEQTEEFRLLLDASQSTPDCGYYERCSRNRLFREFRASSGSCSGCPLVSKQ